MIKTLLITRDIEISSKIENILKHQEGHELEILSMEKLTKKESIFCDIIIYHIGKKEYSPFEVTKILSENAPVIALVNGDKLKNKNKTSLKLIQSGAKTVLYDTKESILLYSVERIYDLEYNQQGISEKVENSK